MESVLKGELESLSGVVTLVLLPVLFCLATCRCTTITQESKRNGAFTNLTDVLLKISALI